MKILYFSDNYAYNVMGTKRSIAEELKKRGFEVKVVDKKAIKNLLDYGILSIIEEFQPDQLWLAHSGLELSSEVKKTLTVPVIGFGFSDPYYFSPTRFKSYDIYVTNHWNTFEVYKNDMDIIYSPTACNFEFHKYSYISKNIDVSLIGVGIHPRFNTTQDNRLYIVEILRKAGIKVNVYGRSWPKHDDNFSYIEGDRFLEVIGKSRIGLDLQASYSPLAHRMFEYSACGTPVITRKRNEVERVFKDGYEILTYDTIEELISRLEYYLNNPSLLKMIGWNAHIRCREEHDIKHRVDELLKQLSKKGVAV